MEIPEQGILVEKEIPLRNAMNEVLRDNYIEDCRRGCDRWNRVIESASVAFRLKLPSRRFHRHVGVYSGCCFDPEGNLVTPSEWEHRRDDWLPGPRAREYVESLMQPVPEPGRIANWIAPPDKGINGLPFDFQYVLFSKE